jgi:hypothetical protein
MRPQAALPQQRPSPLPVLLVGGAYARATADRRPWGLRSLVASHEQLRKGALRSFWFPPEDSNPRFGPEFILAEVARRAPHAEPCATPNQAKLLRLHANARLRHRHGPPRRRGNPAILTGSPTLRGPRARTRQVGALVRSLREELGVVLYLNADQPSRLISPRGRLGGRSARPSRPSAHRDHGRLIGEREGLQQRLARVELLGPGALEVDRVGEDEARLGCDVVGPQELCSRSA